MAESTAPRILVAGHSPSMKQSLLKFFAKAGHTRVAFTSDRTFILKALASGKVDLLASDWQVVAHDDYTLLKSIGKMPGVVPVLVMVSKVPEEKLAQAQKLGVKRFIASPFGPGDLAEAVKLALDSKPPSAKAAPPPQAKDHDAPEQPANPAELIQRAHAALEAGDHKTAATLFARALKADDLIPEAHKGMADAMEAGGDEQASRGFMNRAAEVYVEVERDDEAEALYRAITEKRPDAPNPFKTVSRKFKDQGRRERGVAALERAQALTPDDDEIVAELSRDYMDMGEQEKALGLAKSLLEKGRESPLTRELFLEITGSDWYYGNQEPEGTIQILDDVKEKAVKGSDQRRAKRLAFADRSVRFAGSDEHHPVVDISAGGLGFKPMSAKLKSGQHLTLDIMVMSDPRIKKIKVVVRRVSEKIIGCEFLKLSGKQAKAIKALVE